MRDLLRPIVLLTVVLYILADENFCRGESGADDKRAEESILGAWQADSVTLLTEKGGRKTLPKIEQKPISVIISEKSLTMRVGDQMFAEMPYVTMRVGDQMFAEMPYVLDSKQTPCAIDVKYQEQEMPGIYELSGDSLKISLNDAKKGRPKDFGGNEVDMDLVLHRFKGQPLMVIDADGSDLRILLSMNEFTSCGSPEWSHDGSKITFDCWRSSIGETYTSSHVFVVDADGKNPKDLGDGTLPSWSPDGKRIVYGRYYSGNSVWIMNADSSDKQLVDENGWGPDWSPKKDELAYTIFGEQGANLCVYNPQTQERHNLLEKQYSQVYWGLSWSPDGQWICFKGDLPDGGSEVAIVHAQGQSKGFKVLIPNKAISGVKEFDRYFSWSPDGKWILAPIMMEGDNNLQMYMLDPDGKAPPKKLAGQDASVRNYGTSWSPDGKRIVLTFWPGAAAQKKEQTKSLLNRVLNLVE